jgi:hypothetical protein
MMLVPRIVKTMDDESKAKQNNSISLKVCSSKPYRFVQNGISGAFADAESVAGSVLCAPRSAASVAPFRCMTMFFNCAPRRYHGSDGGEIREVLWYAYSIYWSFQQCFESCSQVFQRHIRIIARKKKNLISCVCVFSVQLICINMYLCFGSL